MNLPIHNSTTTKAGARSGVTIIELLVVVSIIAVLSAMLIPRLRTINKDRNIREAARVVGAEFNSASQRARVEGAGGVVIVTNLNLVDTTLGGQVFYGGTVMYQLRSLPPYSGDGVGSAAFVQKRPTTGANAPEPPLVVSILLPFEHSPARPFIRVNDRIKFGGSSVSYRISFVTISGNSLLLTLDRGNGDTLIEDFGPLPLLPRVQAPSPDPDPSFSFVIERQPKVIRSSRTELPAGYIIDMRYSGPLGGPAGTLFHQEIENAVVVYFNRSGGIDRMNLVPQAGPLANTYFPPPNNGQLIGPLQLLVTEDNPNPEYISLDRDNSLWVSVESATGTVNVGVNNPRSPGERVLVENLPPNPTPTNLDQMNAYGFTAEAISSARADAGAYGAAQ